MVRPRERRHHGELARVALGVNVVGRALAPMEHHGPGGIAGVLLGPPFYAAALAVGAFPVAWAVVRVARRRRELPPALVRTVLAGVALPLLAFSLAATKLPHYVLPALPLVAVAAAAVRMRGVAAAWAASALLLAATAGVAHLAPWKAAGEAVAARGGALDVGLTEPSLLYYARGTLRLTDLEGVAAAATAAPAHVLMAEPAALLATRALPRLRFEQLDRWSGWNLAHGRRVAVGLFLVSAAPAAAPGPSLPMRSPHPPPAARPAALYPGSPSVIESASR